MIDVRQQPSIFGLDPYQKPKHLGHHFGSPPWQPQRSGNMTIHPPASHLVSGSKAMEQQSHLPSPQSMCDGDAQHEDRNATSSIDLMLHQNRDPLLYERPEDEARYDSLFSSQIQALNSHQTPPTSPLFETDIRSPGTGGSDHEAQVRAKEEIEKLTSSYPTVKEQNIMLGFVSKAWESYPGSRWEKERQLRINLEQKNGILSSPTKARRASALDDSTSVQSADLPPSPKKSRLGDRRASRPVRPLSLQSIPESTRCGIHSPVRTSAGAVRPSPTPTVSSQRHQDTDWESIPDYTPPPYNLASDNRNGLKIQPRTNTSLEIRHMDNIDLLHPSEVTAASLLRLTPDQYLTVKRRIFQARFETLREGKPWNKTAAQTRCHIDVNKTSNLWAAYEKLGWFDERLMADHLSKAKEQ